MTKTKTFIISLLLLSLTAQAQTPKAYFGATPPLKVSGKEIVDPNGKAVTLHGVMDTPSRYFNKNRWDQPGWAWDKPYGEDMVEACIDYFDKIFTAITDTEQGAYCNLFRLHLDPAWTNDTDVTSVDLDAHGNTVSGEANVSRFSEERLRRYLELLYVPIAEDALKHGLYVIIRPPGVFPHDVSVGDYYQRFLLKVWDIISSNEKLQRLAGQISFELGNEPVNMTGNLVDYFQPIVDKIRANGFSGILWLPGTNYQANYTDYTQKSINDPKNNYGFAVHCYPGWYGGWDKNKTQEQFINTFEQQVSVVEDYPIVITEVDWSPMFNGTGHWNETHTQFTAGNFGTWATGTTYQAPTTGVEPVNTQNNDWGIRFRTLTDKHTNISWTLQGTTTYVNMDKYLANGTVEPAFLDEMKSAGYNDAYQACSGACMGWYHEYACGDRLPEYEKGRIENLTNDNTVYDEENNKYIFKYPYSSAFLFNVLKNKRVKDVAELVISIGEESTIGYRLDFKLKTIDSNGKETIGSFIVGGNYGVDNGTRIDDLTVTENFSHHFDIQTILADYMESSNCLDYYFDEIRINTVVPNNEESINAAKNGAFYIKDIRFDVYENNIFAIKNNGTDLKDIPFSTYARVGNAVAVSETAITHDNNLGNDATEVGSGGTIYGTSGVNYNEFVDLKGYSKLTLKGIANKLTTDNTGAEVKTKTDDPCIRLLFNRPRVPNGQGTNGSENSTGWLEKVVPLNESGVEIDLTQCNITKIPDQYGQDAPFNDAIHLHAIKVNWGYSATINSAVLKKSDGTTEDLSEVKYKKWNVQVEGEKFHDIEGNNVNLNVPIAAGDIVASANMMNYVTTKEYCDLSAYTRMKLQGEGNVRLILNSDYDELIKPEYTFAGNLTNDIYKQWDGFEASAQATDATPNFVSNIGVSNTNVYGNSNVEGRDYAELTCYAILELIFTEGTPRLLLNRKSLDNSGEYIEINSSSSPYVHTDIDGIWRIDLAKITKEHGYAHLNAIKGANWANVKITEAKLYTATYSNIDYTTVDNLICVDKPLSADGTIIDLTDYQPAHLHSILAFDGTANVTSIRLFNDNEQLADYYLHGAGHTEDTAIEAYNDEIATVIDVTGLTSSFANTYTFSNPNCLIIQSENQQTKGLIGDTRNLVTKTSEGYNATAITLEDGHTFRSPVDIATNNVTYSRNNLSTRLGTATIPFEFTVNSDNMPEIFLLTEISDGKMVFTKLKNGTLVEAYTPILFRKAENQDVSFSGRNIKKTEDGWNMKPLNGDGLSGWYICQSMVDKVIEDVTTDEFFKNYDVYVINKDKFVLVRQKLTSKTFRTFFLHEKSTHAPATSFSIAIEDDINGISDASVDNHAVVTECYDASGRRISTPSDGVNIIRMSDGSVRKALK